MPDGAYTYCPYCGATLNANNYVWRNIEVTGYENFPEPTPKLKAIEVYCAQCHRTLSITPLP